MKRRFISGTILNATRNNNKVGIKAKKIIHLGENYMIIESIVNK